MQNFGIVLPVNGENSRIDDSSRARRGKQRPKPSSASIPAL
jgi:hypothetical protein